MSALPSPLKSPVPDLPARPRIDRAGRARWTARSVPFISQIAAVPSSFCHRMSALPSPLKSPVPLTCQLGPGLTSRRRLAGHTVVPFISQIAGVPPLSATGCRCGSRWRSPRVASGRVPWPVRTVTLSKASNSTFVTTSVPSGPDTRTEELVSGVTE